eukprot:Selendium_serpulae@DN6457_c0_g1_i3.p1
MATTMSEPWRDGTAESRQDHLISQPTAGQSSEVAVSSADPNNATNVVAGTEHRAPGEKVPLKFFVGGIHPDCWDDELRGYFSKFCSVKEVHIMVDKATGRNRGFGFVTLEDEREKDKVFDKDHFIRDKRCSVRQMQPEGVSNLKRKVFIGGINPALTENDLEPYFKTW